MNALYINHKSPRLFILECKAWLAGKTSGSNGEGSMLQMTTHDLHGIFTVVAGSGSDQQVARIIIN